MPLAYLKENSLCELKDSVSKNLDLYELGTFNDFFDYEEFTREIKGDFDLEKLKHLMNPKDDNNFDAENSKIIIETLSNLTPLQAREERFWAHLCHFDCLEYARERWPIPEKEPEKHVLTHFFASTSRGLERDNAISRLWWMGFIANRVKGIKMDEALKVLMFKADVRANIIERPTTSTSISVFSAILHLLKKSYEGKQILHERSHFRAFMKEINRIGGVRLLNFFEVERLTPIFEEIISKRLGLTEI